MFLERVYKKEADFQELSNNVQLARLKYNMQDVAYVQPPSQRSIARFMNMSKWIDWISRMQYLYHTLRDDIKSIYAFIPHNAWPTPVPAGQFFYGFDVSQSTLFVPQGTRQDYWVAAVWEDFGDIQEYEVSAVNQPAHHSEAKEVSRYSLDGQRLTAPVKGLNIVRYSDGTIKKEAVPYLFTPSGALGKGAQAARSCWVGLLQTSLLTLPPNRPLPTPLSPSSMASTTNGRLSALKGSAYCPSLKGSVTTPH